MNYEGRCICGVWIEVDAPWSEATIKARHDNHAPFYLVYIGPEDSRRSTP